MSWPGDDDVYDPMYAVTITLVERALGVFFCRNLFLGCNARLPEFVQNNFSIDGTVWDPTRTWRGMTPKVPPAAITGKNAWAGSCHPSRLRQREHGFGGTSPCHVVLPLLPSYSSHPTSYDLHEPVPLFLRCRSNHEGASFAVTGYNNTK